jgi:hypothetical protein
MLETRTPVRVFSCSTLKLELSQNPSQTFGGPVNQSKSGLRLSKDFRDAILLHISQTSGVRLCQARPPVKTNVEQSNVRPQLTQTQSVPGSVGLDRLGSSQQSGPGLQPYQPIQDTPVMPTLGTPARTPIARGPRVPRAPQQEGWLDLSGGQLEISGKKLFVVEGRVTRFNENTGEVLGQMSILSSIKPSLLNGHVTLKVGRLEFMLNMLQSEPSTMPGEHRMRFSAVLVRA